jgi:hypothetical protein
VRFIVFSSGAIEPEKVISFRENVTPAPPAANGPVTCMVFRVTVPLRERFAGAGVEKLTLQPIWLI